MQVQIMAVEYLNDKKDIHFPHYDKDGRLASWGSAVEKLSLPAILLTEKYGEQLTFTKKVSNIQAFVISFGFERSVAYASKHFYGRKNKSLDL